MLSGAQVGGAATAVILSIALAAGHLAGPGVAALGAAGFLLLAAWCATHRRVDQTLVAFALYLGLLDGYVKLRTGNPVVTLARDVLIIATATGVLLRAAQGRERLVLPPLAGFVVAFSAVVLVEVANPDGRGLAASFAGVRQHLEFVPLFFLGYAFVRTKSQIRMALLVLVLCAAVGGVVSYIQSQLTPEQLADWGPGYSERILGTGVFTGAGRTAQDDTETFVRPFGLGSDAGAGATTAALALPGLVVLLMAARRRLRWAVVPMSVGVGLAVATSGSRAAIIVAFATLVAFGLIAAASRNGLMAVAGLAVGIALVYAVFLQLGPETGTAKRAQSITPGKALSTFVSERGSSVKAFGGLASDHPLGVGLATAGPASGFQGTTLEQRFNAETQWNFLVLETGILGVVVYVGFLLTLMWLALRRIRLIEDPELRLYLAALAAPIVGMPIAGFSGITSASVPSAPFLWLVSGVLAYWLVTQLRHGASGRAAVS